MRDDEARQGTVSDSQKQPAEATPPSHQELGQELAGEVVSALQLRDWHTAALKSVRTAHAAEMDIAKQKLRGAVNELAQARASAEESSTEAASALLAAQAEAAAALQAEQERSTSAIAVLREQHTSEMDNTELKLRNVENELAQARASAEESSTEAASALLAAQAEAAAALQA
eukprot:COSAG02_NODE_25914_length_645_cov_2.163004_1_plen_172_part_10